MVYWDRIKEETRFFAKCPPEHTKEPITIYIVERGNDGMPIKSGAYSDTPWSPPMPDKLISKIFDDICCKKCSERAWDDVRILK